MAIQVIREVSADVVKRGATRAVYAKQRDCNSRFLNVRIQEEGNDIKIDPSLKVVLNVKRPDNAENMFFGTVNADGTVQVLLTTWMLELVGTLECDISIVSEDPDVAKLTTMKFNIYIEEAVVEEENIVYTEEYSLIVELLSKVTQAEREAAAAAEHSRSVLFIGSEEPPESAIVWIDPNGRPSSTEKWEFEMVDGSVKTKSVVVIK